MKPSRTGTGVKKRGAGESRKQGSKEFQVSVMISDTSSPLFRDTNATSNAKCSHRFTKYDEVSGERDYFWLEDVWAGLMRRWNTSSLK